ncbi:MAG TPA: rod-binding protein [Acidobacteriaceae bacterium]|nr:rod-binding protein [Acidobacteriaceae bacterium]
MGSSAIGPGSLATQTSITQVRETQMLQQLKSAQGDSSNDPRIEKSAKEFEAMLFGSWLQQAEKSFATVPGAEDDEDAATRDQMMSLGVQSLSQAMANSGGIGIAKMITKALEAQAARTEGASTAPTAADTNSNGKS